MNYNINYSHIGGRFYTCGMCSFRTNDLYGELIPHYRDWGHSKNQEDMKKNNLPFNNQCQIFVKLKLNHIGMKNKLNEVRRNANLNGEFNSKEYDSKMQYHVSLLQIYVNIKHPKFRKFLDNKDKLLKLINEKFLKAFYNKSFEPLNLESLGENFIVQKLQVNDRTFLDYVNAKRSFYAEFNKLLGKNTNEDSVYYPNPDTAATGKRFFLDNEPFLFIRDFYLTPNDPESVPTNNFMPHISVLSTKEHGLSVSDEKINSFIQNVNIPNPINIDQEFSVISEISINKNSIDPNIIKESDKESSYNYWYILGSKEDYFTNDLKNRILSCNS